MSVQQTETPAHDRKFLEPTLHFATQFLKIGEDDTTDKIPVTELVQENQMLANFPNFQAFASEGYEKALIEVGDNVEYSEDGESLHASTIGYPKVTKINRDDVDGTITVISIEPLFIYEADKMKVSLALHPQIEGGHSLSDENIDDLIQAQGIVYGLHEEAVEDIKRFINSGAKEFKKIAIAVGQPVGESEDAYLRYDIEIGPIAGTILENGNIDFRDRRIMVGVESGQRIATKIPAVQGISGINVLGEETEAREGKDMKVEVLNDAKFSQETMEVTATKNGVLSIVNNNVIKVLSHHVIAGNVDYETGNVQSMNSVTIQGSVQPGFKIDVGGDLRIIGGISSALIHCNGNVVINGGITGKSPMLVTNGDIDLNFIENGVIDAGGLVVVRRQSYYSKISAGAAVRCQMTSKIMGGKLIAAGNITAGDIGSENSTPSILAAGVLNERLQQYLNFKSFIVDQQEAIIQWLHKYKGSSQSKKIKKMEQELSETKLKLLRLNLIPGSGTFSRTAPPDDAPPDAEEFSDENSIAIEKIKIDIHGTVFGGTEIRIGNRTMKLDKTVSKRQFKLDPKGKRIIAVPIRR